MTRLILIILLSLSVQIQAQDWEWVFGIVNEQNNKSIYSKILQIDNKENIYLGLFDNNYLTSTAGLSFNEYQFNHRGINDIYIGKINNSQSLEWIVQTGGLNMINQPEYLDKITSSIYSEKDNALFVTGITFSNRLYFENSIVLSSESSQINFLLKISSSGQLMFASNLQGLNGKLELIDENGNIFISGFNTNLSFLPMIGAVKGGWIAKLDSSGNLINVVQPLTGNKDLSSASGVSVKYEKIIAKDGSLWIDAMVFDDTLITNENQQIVISATPQMSSFEFDQNLIYTNNSIERSRLPFNHHIFKGDIPDNSYLIYGRCNDDSTYNESPIFPNYGLNFCIYKFDANNTLGHVVIHKFDSLLFLFPPMKYSEFTNSFYIIGLFPKGENIIEIGSFRIGPRSRPVTFILRFNSVGDVIGLRTLEDTYWGLTLVFRNNSMFLSGTFKKELKLGNHLLNADGWNWNVYVAKIPEFTGFLRETNRIDEEQLLVFPNPGEGIYRVNIPSDLIQEKELQVLITSSDGRLIRQFTVDPFNGQFPMDISKVSDGVYYIRLSSPQRSYYGKIIKLR